ncbi:amidohydrolase [Ferruginibacter paludis]|uniref:amidohydrolase n=1 Tax=Ferruginibacter paludis TaxID=1310417 RepID=UPI0025B3DB10|nr:amidohydrolase [Ferruginibacter paludis]MDN3657021.1 amidohydrolase [Ferruginibacter paludis]
MNKKVITFLSILIFSIGGLHAQVSKQVKQMAYADSGRLVEIFKDLHQNPELGFMEVRTSAIIEKELKALGYEVMTGIGKTGVVGILKNGAGPVVMYRADMDCNSVKEITGLPYSSTKTMKKVDGTEVPVMHACGHDAHVTWLLEVAKIMASIKNEWKGTLVMLAQPAEEPLTGAKAMVNDKMYDKGVPVPDYLFGLHTTPIATGSIKNGAGERAAGSDQLDVTFYGIGGHGSTPELTKDPVVMACNAVLQYQTIVSRSIAAQDVAVLTVGAIHSGGDNNVIPASAVVKLNLRWFNERIRTVLLDGIKRINEGIAVANGVAKENYPSILMKGSVYPQVNDPALSAKVNKALTPLLTPEKIITDTPPIMGSEDFNHLVLGNNKTLCDYIWVGTAQPDLYAKAVSEGKSAPFYNHNGNYQVDLAAIPLGAVIGTTTLLELFKK